MIENLFENRLIFVTGKGGVGKSTVTAAIGLALARQGRRTLVLETDTFSAMEDLFGFKSTGLQPVKLQANLWASNLLAEDCFLATLRRFVPGERIARAIINNRVARIFFEAAPSVNEITILDQIRVFFEETNSDGSQKYQHILVDLPASGHAVTFLNVPATMNGMMRGVGPIAKMSAQVSKVIQDKKTTAIIAVCLPEEMPVNETIELADNLKTAIGRPLTMALVNMVNQAPLDEDERDVFNATRHDISPPEQRQASTLSDGVSEHIDPAVRLLEGNALAIGWHDRDQRYLKILHDRLREPIVEIPIFYEIDGAKTLDNIATFLSKGEVNE